MSAGAGVSAGRKACIVSFVRFVAAASVLFTVASASGQSAPPSPTLAQDIGAIVARQTALITQRDPAGLAALFAPDGVYVAANGAAFGGRAQIQEYYTRLFAILEQSRGFIGDVARRSKAEQVVAWGEGAWATGRGITVASGSQTVTVADHWVAIYVKVNNEWKIRVFSVGEDAPECRC